MFIKLENRKWKWLLGMMLAVFCPVSCMMLGYSLKAGLVLMAAVAAVTVFRLEFLHRTVLTGIYAILFPLVSLLSFLVGLIMQNLSIAQIGVDRIIINTAIHSAFQMIILVISGKLKLSIIIGSFIPFAFTLVNCYVYLFRGNALTPADFLSVQTAANVAAEYDFTPTPTVLYALLIMGIIYLSLFCLPDLQLMGKKSSKLISIGVCAVCLLGIVFCTSQYNAFHWANEGAQVNGYPFNFLLQMKGYFVNAPRNYNAETAYTLSTAYPKEGAPSSRPDIIVIMDESFADFRVFSDIPGSDADIMPYIDSLRDNTIHGFLTASVFGGSTANSEYECLSGNTMAFLPNGSIVYQQYYSEESWSLVSFLKGQGYDCTAMHPYHANGWMRDTVYPKMGFEELYFLPDFPQEQLIRGFVSDQEMFEQIIRINEAQDVDMPLFLFGVTVQNHGGYAYEGADFQNTVSVEGYPKASQYLTLARETDRAVEYLIEHYKTVERDTVIVFFGDHMPNVEPAFYEELNGGPFDTLDEQMKKQMVPFFVWANFDIEERQIPCSSINYLPLYTLEAAGLPLPPYMQFLKDTEAVIPAINAYGYYSAQEQCFLPLEDASGAEADAIRAYEYLQYNNMFDSEHRSEHFFGNEP